MTKVLLKNNHATISQKYVDKVAVLTIEHPKCKAQLSLYGGQVLSWQPSNQQEIFWLSKAANFQGNKAIRGGIPLCWPWFGSLLVKDNNVGNHGFARQSLWQLEQCEANKDGVLVTLVLAGNNCHPQWRHAFHLRQSLYFSHYFSQQLIVNNLSTQAINFTGAFHNYFHVSDPNNITIDNLHLADFEDKLNQESHAKKPSDAINFSGPIDRIYHSHKAMKIIDKDWQRSIIIETQNMHQWVLWNPGQQGAPALSDIHVRGEKEFICLEAANTKAQIVKAEGSMSMQQKITIE